MNKLILGICGEMASGKGTVASHVVKKYNGSSHRFSTMMRDILDRIHVEQTRENLQNLSEALRKTYGEDVFAKSMQLDVDQDEKEVVVIDGIRRLPDIVHLHDLPHFKLLYIDADINKKYERIVQRNENKDDMTKTFEQFQKDHEGEAESQIRELKNHADFIIDNNGTFEDLYSQVDALIEENIK